MQKLIFCAAALALVALACPAPSVGQSINIDFQGNTNHNSYLSQVDPIDYVFINGEHVVDGGKHTGARPGRMLRRGQD